MTTTIRKGGSIAFQQVNASKPGSTPRRDDLAPRIVLHTTEMVSPTPEKMLKAYQNHPWPPHLWVSFSGQNSYSYKKQWGSAVKSKVVRDGYDLAVQGIPFHKTAYALRAPKVNGLKYETNHAGKYCVQVEIEGYAADTRDWSDLDLEVLGRQVVAPIVKWIRENGYPDFRLVPYQDVGMSNGSYGERDDKKGRGQARMSYEDWMNRTGGQHGDWTIATHQHIPKNSHWDCGGLNLAKVCHYANAELAEAPTADLPIDELIQKLRTALTLAEEVKIRTSTG